MRSPLRAALCAVVLFSCARREVADRAVPPPSAAAPQEGLARGTVRFETPRGPWLVEVEVAGTQEDRARGLMFRKELAADRGMLFVFDQTEEHSFWMRNTLLSLDMIFLGEDRAVVGVVANTAPRTDVARTVGKPSRYVVEVTAGEAAAHAVGPGTRAVFVGVRE